MLSVGILTVVPSFFREKVLSRLLRKELKLSQESLFPRVVVRGRLFPQVGLEGQILPRLVGGFQKLPFISRIDQFESETQIKGCLLPALGFLERSWNCKKIENHELKLLILFFTIPLV